EAKYFPTMRRMLPVHEAELRQEADRAERGEILAEAEPAILAAKGLDQITKAGMRHVLGLRTGPARRPVAARRPRRRREEWPLAGAGEPKTRRRRNRGCSEGHSRRAFRCLGGPLVGGTLTARSDPERTLVC